jgi:prevent-host-death family protein
MTATDAARSFSELLNRVAGGEEIEVTRGGAAVAVILPPRSGLISAGRFRELIATARHPTISSSLMSVLLEIRSGGHGPTHLCA